MKKRWEFQCPECGGRTFGTSLQANEGSCHGHKPFEHPPPHQGFYGFAPCTFRWSRAEDWRYFTLVIAADSPTDNRVLYAIGESPRPPRVRVHNAGFEVHLSAPSIPNTVLAQVGPNKGAAGLPPPAVPPKEDGTYIHEDEHRARIADRESATALPSDAEIPPSSYPTLPSQPSPDTTSPSRRASLLSDTDEVE